MKFSYMILLLALVYHATAQNIPELRGVGTKTENNEAKTAKEAAKVEGSAESNTTNLPETPQSQVTPESTKKNSSTAETNETPTSIKPSAEPETEQSTVPQTPTSSATSVKPVDPISCIICGGSNTACSNDLTETPSKCPDASYKNCFSKLDDKGKIERGCLIPNTNCKPKKKCISTAAGKNNQVVCKYCDKANNSCSQIDVNDGKYNIICAEDVRNCFMKVEDKRVIRNCTSDEIECHGENTCKICEGNYCNSGLFPENRISCYQCSGANCNNVTTSALKVCEQYVENDECYTTGESNTTMTRGCRSDSNDNKCSMNAEGCVFCNATNCNNMKFMRDQTLKCYQCTGNITDVGCAKEQTGSDFKNCEKQIRYNATDSCYTLQDDATIQRGCFYDNDECVAGSNATCTKCNQTNGCNSNAYENTCIVCRSDSNKNCWNNADQLKGEKCPTISSCFYGIWHGIAIRGCLVDASPQDQWICEDPKNNQCHVCSSQNCNTQKSSGAKTIPSSFAIILIVLTILEILK